MQRNNRQTYTFPKYYKGSSVGNRCGTSKRPHVRYEHYHHFGVGSEIEGSRRLILRYVSPTLVNGSADDAIVTKIYCNSIVVYFDCPDYFDTHL